MTDQEARVQKLSREAAAKYMGPFRETDEDFKRHSRVARETFDGLRERQERELAAVIADAIRAALKEANTEGEHTANMQAENCRKYQNRNVALNAQLADARERLTEILEACGNSDLRTAMAKGDELLGTIEDAIDAREATDLVAREAKKPPSMPQPQELFRIPGSWFYDVPVTGIALHGPEGARVIHTLVPSGIIIRQHDMLSFVLHPGPEPEVNPRALTDEEIVEQLQSILEESELGVTVEQLLAVIREDLQPPEPEYDDEYGQEDPDDEA